jgi:hypothetical protein
VRRDIFIDLGVPNGRRLGHVNVICVYSHQMCGREGGEKGAMGTGQGGQKMGQLTLSMGPAWAEVCSYEYVQRATIPSKRVNFYLFIKPL